MTGDLDRELRDLLPHLEESLDSLKPGECQILLARFFDNQRFPEIATSTGKSESACKMSLRRTLEKLRLKLTSRGITYSTITLGTILQTEWAKATPTHLTATLPKTAVAAQPVGWAGNLLSRISTPKVLTLVTVTFLDIACHQVIQRDSNQSDTKTHATNSTIDGAGSTPSTQKRSNRKIRQQTHQASALKHFYLPPTDLKNVSLQAAGKIIIEKYETICRETDEIALPLVWKINSHKAHIQEIHLHGNLFQISQKLAIVSGTKFKLKGTSFIFQDIPEMEEHQLTTREFMVPPTFEGWFNNFPNKRPPHAWDWDWDYYKDNPLDFTSTSRKIGLIDKDEKAIFDRSSTKLRVRARAGSMAKIEALVELARSDLPLQIRFTSQFGLNETLTDLPVVVALPGQPATLEIGKKYLELNEEKTNKVWGGHYLHISADLYGLGERSIVDYSHNQKPTKEALARYQKSGRLDDLDLKLFEIKNGTMIRTEGDRLNGRATRFDHTDRDGNALSLLILSERIDAVGRSFIPQ